MQANMWANYFTKTASSDSVTLPEATAICHDVGQHSRDIAKV
jgi:hypothetical protein